METEDDIGQIKQRRVCINCVGEEFLKDQISKQGTFATCSYCGKEAKSFSINEMSERVEVAFNQHYERTPTEPDSFQYRMLADKESSYSWEREGEPVIVAIMNAADIPEEAASDIQEVLNDKFADFEIGEETPFSPDSYYQESATTDDRWWAEWRAFERSLKTETRFFSRSASDLLARVFDGIDKMQTRDGRPLIVDAGPDTRFSTVFRARVFQSPEKLENALARLDEQLGSPPSEHALAGRMNAHGISVFYGANDPLVALAEVRPPVGSKVVVAKFHIVRPIGLLDLTALSSVTTSGSIFDPTFIGHLERMMFLRNLSFQIANPVMPEREMLEYLPTQAIADFLANESSPPLEGIVFPSVQVAGEALNFVLFHKAARVQRIELPEGTKVRASLGQMYDEGWETEYDIVEEVPPKKKKGLKKDELEALRTLFRGPTLNRDERPATLSIDLDAVRVHHVTAVKFTTDDYEVTRRRWERG
jgi:hypothetical protein